MSGDLPTSGRRSDLSEGSDTIHPGLQIDHVLHQSSRSRYDLEGRSGCRLILCGKIQLRTGFIRVQLCIIFRIHSIGHLVIIISRIRYHSQHITGIDIRNDYRSIAGIQRQLCRRDLQIGDPVHHELICRHFTGIQCLFILRGNIYHMLFTQQHADLSSGDLII